MKNFSFEMVEKENESFLEPLTCKCMASELELGAGTLKGTLYCRWGGIGNFVGRLRVSSDFWPSTALLEKASSVLAKGNSFRITDGEEAVAEFITGSDVVETLPSDSASFRIRYPWDLLKVNEEYLSEITESSLLGTVREHVTLDGIVILGEGSVLLPGVYIEGVAVIGRDCKIGPNCYLRGNNFIGDRCHIGQAVEIKNSILMTHVAAGHLSYIGDSLVCRNVNFGAGTITSNFRHDGKNHRSMVNGSLCDTGRRKFGAVIGENVHTGIHTAIYPGRKLWADVQTRPGDVVQLDLMR